MRQLNIENKSSKEHTVSDEWGTFNLLVAIGDTLVFEKINYQEIQKVIFQKQNLLIYLNRAITLNEVKVKGQSKSAEQKEILEDFRSKGVFFNGNPPLLAYIFNPLTVLNELISSDASNARKFSNYIGRENAESMVDRHFNAIVIRKAIAIKDDELVEFMYLHRPKPEDVKYRSYYEDMEYVKKAYLLYMKNKKSQF